MEEKLLLKYLRALAEGNLELADQLRHLIAGVCAA